MDDARLLAEVTQRTALLLLAKGRKLPAYLSSLSFRERLAAVQAIDSYVIPGVPDELFVSLIKEPYMVAAIVDRDVDGEGTAAIWLDTLKTTAETVIESWSVGSLAELYLAAGHLAAEQFAAVEGRKDAGS